jgi:hypothetical protein
MTNNKTNRTEQLNQNDIVINFLRKNRRKGLTSEQICTAVNTTLPKSKRLTTTQISKCLNRFSVKKMVKKMDKYGEHSTGRQVPTWTYVSAKS